MNVLSKVRDKRGRNKNSKTIKKRFSWVQQKVECSLDYWRGNCESSVSWRSYKVCTCDWVCRCKGVCVWESVCIEVRVSVCVLQPSTLPLTCNRAVYLISAAGFLATHVYSPECVADNEGMLSSELYWSNIVTLAPNSSGSGSPSLSQISLSGASPRETPQTVRVRIPSARPSWNANGSMIGGTASRKEQAHWLREQYGTDTQRSLGRWWRDFGDFPRWAAVCVGG